MGHTQAFVGTHRGVDALLGDRGVAVVEVLRGLAHHQRVGVDDALGEDARPLQV